MTRLKRQLAEQAEELAIVKKRRADGRSLLRQKQPSPRQHRANGYTSPEAFEAIEVA